MCTFNQYAFLSSLTLINRWLLAGSSYGYILIYYIVMIWPQIFCLIVLHSSMHWLFPWYGASWFVSVPYILWYIKLFMICSIYLFTYLIYILLTNCNLLRDKHNFILFFLDADPDYNYCLFFLLSEFCISYGFPY